MELTLQRDDATAERTIGHLFVDKAYECLGGKMTPGAPILDIEDAVFLNSEFAGNDRCSLASGQSLPNGKNIIGREHRLRVLLSSVVSQAGLAGMLNILLACGRLQIFNAIVVFVSVQMVDLEFFSQPQKCFCDQTMNLRQLARTILGKVHGEIPAVPYLSGHDLSKHATGDCAGSAAIVTFKPWQRADLPFARDFVTAFVPSDRAPYFHPSILLRGAAWN